MIQRVILLLVLTSALARAGQPLTNAPANPGSMATPDPISAQNRIHDKVNELTKGRTPEEAFKAIAAWKQSEPNSPDPYIVSANYRLSLVSRPISKLLAGPATDAVDTQGQLLAAAADLEEASKKFPTRFDVMLGRATILMRAQQWTPLTAQLEIVLDRAAHDPKSLRWMGNQALFLPAVDLATDAVQKCFNASLNEKSAAGDARAKALSELGLKYFPTSIIFLSNLGSIHAMAGEFPEAASYYERALESAPDDSLICSDLALVELKAGRKDKAREMAQKVIKLNKDPADVKSMNTLLEKIDSSPEPGKPNAK